MTSLQTHEPQRSQRSAFVWAGIAASLLGLPLIYAQFSLGYLVTPWYSPALATLGALLLLCALVRRVSVFRVVVLLLLLALAGFQWFLMGAKLKLPAYEGPAQAGERFPAFSSARADGEPFTDADLRDGSRRVMVFFRGRW